MPAATWTHQKRVRHISPDTCRARRRYLVLTSDRPGRSNGGGKTLAVDVAGVNLTNRGVRVMLADDPAVYQRQVTLS